MTAKLPWRQATTLILARNSGGVGREVTDLSEKQMKILYVKRSSRNSDMFSSNYAFPGGTLDPADSSGKWWGVYQRLSSRLGLESVQQFLSALKFDKELLLYSEPHQSEREFPSHIAFRICAIREMFEETGLLLCLGLDNITEFQELCRKGSSHFSKVGDVSKWRELVHKDANNFVDLCSEYNCVPNIWSLIEWSNWLTPASLPKRWDTLFYVSVISEKYSPSADHIEISSVEWFKPKDILQKACKGELRLPVPTAYESSRINRFSGVEMLDRFARWRADQYSCSRLTPVVQGMEWDSVVATFHGDSFYENNKGKQATNSLELNKHGLVNRHIRCGPDKFNIVCNAVPADGHLIPSLLTVEGITSKL